MVLIEYMRERVSGGITTPPWVVNGGHWLSPVDRSLVGWVDDPATREYYVPDTVTTLTRAEFITRQLNIHSSVPFQKGEPGSATDMTTSEVETMAGDWYDTFWD